MQRNFDALLGPATYGARKHIAAFSRHRKKYRAPISHWYGARKPRQNSSG